MKDKIHDFNFVYPFDDLWDVYEMCKIVFVSYHQLWLIVLKNMKSIVCFVKKNNFLALFKHCTVLSKKAFLTFCLRKLIHLPELLYCIHFLRSLKSYSMLGLSFIFLNIFHIYTTHYT